MPTHRIRRGAALLPGETGKADSSPIYISSLTNTLRYVPASTGAEEQDLSLLNQITYAVDGAISVASQLAYLTKPSAGAYTLAAPGTAGIGAQLKITTGTDFAHVVTFTGTTLQDGTAGANSTWTSAAVQGSSITVVGVSATKWNVLSFNLGTIAP
jgi:hypothetical protein